MVPRVRTCTLHWIHSTLNLQLCAHTSLYSSTYQQQAQQWNLYSFLEWSICIFPHLKFSLWTVSVKCFHASVHQLTVMFFPHRMDFLDLHGPGQHATQRHIWDPAQVSSTPMSCQQHWLQVLNGMAEWCHHPVLPLLAEVDQLTETDLEGKTKCFVSSCSSKSDQLYISCMGKLANSTLLFSIYCIYGILLPQE